MIFRWRGWWLALLLILLPASVASQGDSASVQVVRVIDGDTIQVCCVFGDREKVRYIGINTPEIHGLLAPNQDIRGAADREQAEEVPIFIDEEAALGEAGSGRGIGDGAKGAELQDDGPGGQVAGEHRNA